MCPPLPSVDLWYKFAIVSSKYLLPTVTSTCVSPEIVRHGRTHHTVAPEVLRLYESCAITFPDYDSRHSRIIQFCKFCGSTLLRFVKEEEVMPSALAQSVRPQRLADLSHRSSSPSPPSLVEESDFRCSRSPAPGRDASISRLRSHAHPVLVRSRSSSRIDERSNALNPPPTTVATGESDYRDLGGGRRKRPRHRHNHIWT